MVGMRLRKLAGSVVLMLKDKFKVWLKVQNRTKVRPLLVSISIKTLACRNIQNKRCFLQTHLFYLLG